MINWIKCQPHIEKQVKYSQFSSFYLKETATAGKEWFWTACYIPVMCKHPGFILANQVFPNSEPFLSASAHPQQCDYLVSLDAAEYRVLNNCLEQLENIKTAFFCCVYICGCQVVTTGNCACDSVLETYGGTQGSTLSSRVLRSISLPQLL